MMENYYRAVTYDVCEHNDLFIDMNEYVLDAKKDLHKQVHQLAKTDVAPLVKVYKSDTSNDKDFRFYKEYTFKEYECSCTSSE